MNCRNARLALLTISAFIISSGLAFCADWPEYRYDGARTAVSPDELVGKLHPQWTHVQVNAPRPAWPEPGRELNRVDFDYAPQVVSAEGLVFFGSTSDHKVYAVELGSGTERWSFFTGGPIRFAPAYADGRLYVASDDGAVYCLAAADGKVLWTFNASMTKQKLMGNGQLCSRRPLRSGLAVVDGTVYLTAGIWPSEEVYVYALDAATGKTIWRNSKVGSLYLPQPHAPAQGITGVSPQGPIVVEGDQIFVPTGRNIPAAFDRKSGELLYYHSRPNTWGDRWGGSWCFAAPGYVFNWRTHLGPDINVVMGESKPWDNDGLVAFEREGGKLTWQINDKLRACLKDGVLYASGKSKLSAYDWAALAADKKPEEALKWESPCAERVYELIMAGNTLALGAADRVTTYDARNGRKLWEAEVNGQARGLAASAGHLLVSTSLGHIACFGPGALSDAPIVCPATVEATAVAPDDPAAVMAKSVLTETGVKTGYCVVAGSVSAPFVREIIANSDLAVHCLEQDATRVEAIRRELDAGGHYGPDAVVHHGSLEQLPYPDYFADLVVVSPVDTGLTAAAASEVYRITRPGGGAAMMVAGEGGRGIGIAKARIEAAGLPADKVSANLSGVKIVRSRLEGAGRWTHEYADAARTGCGDDALVKLPLKVLWFGEPGPARLVARHWQGPAPLSTDGRLFVIGQYSVVCVDAYNSRTHWIRDLPAVGRFPVGGKGSNAVADEDSVYIATGQKCIRLDAATGETITEYAMPRPSDEIPVEEAAKLTWHFLAVSDGVVMGSVGNEKEARVLFAVDKLSGAVIWSYDAKNSVHHDCVAAGDGMVFILDKPSAAQAAQLARRGTKMSAESILVAMNLRTGAELWKTDRGLQGRSDLRYAQGIAMASGGGRMTAFSADKGRMMAWSKAPMRRPPVIVGDTVYGEPWAYDLSTGERKTRLHPLTGAATPWNFARSYGCGTIAGGTGLLMFRSGIVGLCDLANDSGTHNFGGVRAGCYINVVVANGLLMLPPGDAGCTCSYSLQSTLALAPSDRNENWSVFSAPNLAKGQRLKQLAANFGAPGDQRDDTGKLWLAFPRNAGLAVPMSVELAEGGSYYRTSADETAIVGTDVPWVYTSGASGVGKIAVSMGNAEEHTYTVTLHFAALDETAPGAAVFDIRIQGETVAKAVDIASEVGLRWALVKQFSGVAASDTLTVELVPAGDGVRPIISGLELMQE